MIFNAATNPVGALTGLTHGRVCEDPALRRLVSGLVDEGKAVASAQGITLDADPEELIDHAARPEVAYDHKASMLQDVEARRQTEIDYLNGGIARFGREHGVPTPLNEAILALVKGLEAVVGVSPGEVERRYANVRAALGRDGLDAALVCGSEYTGFEGAVTYLSGFQIVHRYAYVVLPLEGEPSIVFPSEARYVGEHGTSWIEEQVFADRPGDWLADRLRGKRVGVYGLDYVMAPRDYAALEGAAELVPWDVAFDHARAVKSDEELESVRDSVADQHRRLPRLPRGVRARPQRRRGARPRGGAVRRARLRAADDEHGARRGRVRDRPRRDDARRVLHPVARDRRARRPLGRGLARARDAERRGEAHERGLRRVLRGGAGRRCGRARRRTTRTAPSRAGFTERGYHLGHVTGHSIGMTMIEFPKIGEGVETELRENMVFSMHPHVIAENGHDCLYMQETWLVTAEGGVPLSGLPSRIF